MIPESGRFPWRREWQPTPVFLPGESHGQRGLDGYSSRGRKESDTTEHTHTHSEPMSEVLIRRGNEDTGRDIRNVHRQSGKPREASEETKLFDFRLSASRPMR